MKRVIILLLLLVVIGKLEAQKKILFDNTKDETASNADWIIDDNQPIPSPAQSGITATTDETYWQGALSAWGVEMVKQGFYVETLPYNGRITYGDATNSQDLSNYDVFVVCEPNNPFTSAEKQAMLDFVQNGGGLFIVSDHANADRDGDDWDALEVWNDFFSTYNYPFGFKFEEGSNITVDPATNVVYLPSDEILHGVAGDVDGLASYAGATMQLTGKSADVTPLVYKNGVSNTGSTGIMALCATYGKGKVVAIGDSSIPEDETAHDNSNTYPGWFQPEDAGNATGDNGVFVTNATIWLATNSDETQSQSIFISTDRLFGFSYTYLEGPSDSQKFEISFSGFEDMQVRFFTHYYQFSLDNIVFQDTLVLNITDEESSFDVFVRMKQNLIPGPYNDTLLIDSGDIQKKLLLEGKVFEPDDDVIISYDKNISEIEVYSATDTQNYLNIYSLNGKLLKSSAFDGKCYSLNVSELKGLYILEVIANNQKTSKKMFIN